MWWRLFALFLDCAIGFCIDAVALGLYCTLFLQKTNFWPELDILPAQSHWHKYLPLLMSFLAVLLFDFCQTENLPFLLWGFLICSLSSLMRHLVNHPCSSDWPPLDPSCRVIKPGQTGRITQGLKEGLNAAPWLPGGSPTCVWSVSALGKSLTHSPVSIPWETQLCATVQIHLSQRRKC